MEGDQGRLRRGTAERASNHVASKSRALGSSKCMGYLPTDLSSGRLGVRKGDRCNNRWGSI